MKKRPSLFLKLFLGNLVIVTAVVVVAAAGAYQALNAQHRHALYAHEDYLAQVAKQYMEHVWPLPDAGIDGICKGFLQGGGTVVGADGSVYEADVPLRLTVIAPDGRVLGDSQGAPALMENHRTATRPEVLAALEGRTGRDVRRSETLAVDFRYVALPIAHDGGTVGAVRVAMPVKAILESQALLRDVLAWVVLMAVAAFALIGVLINWVWYAPLKRIAEAARQIASGNLAHRASIVGSGELAELGAALNVMRESLAGQIRTIEAQRENLGRVVANLREGILALDAAGRITQTNRAAVDLLAPGERDVVGRPLQAVVRITAIVAAYNEAISSGRSVDRQIEVETPTGRRHLDVHAAGLAPAGPERPGGLLVVRDVTDLVRAAAIKAEFVANASHELRTPLATLRAAVDSLAAVEPGDREGLAKLAGMLDRHVRRLENLTQDLLDLHTVESAKQELTLEPLALGAIAEWCRSLFAERATGKGVMLEFQAPRPDDILTTDRKLVDLVLQNLLDNAVKFTPAGGRVTCLIERQEGGVCLRVTDTGCGIRREDQPRVFQRFFQADAARSGDTKIRGTGLGLAIVKHAAERLGAKVTLESDPGRGTTVTVRVPDRPEA